MHLASAQGDMKTQRKRCVWYMKQVQLMGNLSRFIHAFIAGFSLLHFDGEGVLLVAAHVGITHEVENVFMGAGGGSGEVQFHFRLGLQCQSLDGDQAGRGASRN